MSFPRLTMAELNALPEEQFVRAVGPAFENSPWIARRAWCRRPFASVCDLHAALCDTVRQAGESEKLSLLRAHPDLVGRLARQGRLTPESAREQAAAGLTNLSQAEIAQFERFNAEYRGKFGFPFIICARENRKQAILSAFPLRLNNSPEQELAAALTETFKIARLRLIDLIEEPA